MAVSLNPYLNWRNGTRGAMEFYHSVFGGDLVINTFADFGAAEDPTENDLVMHSQLTTASGLVFMAADTPNRMEWVPGVNTHAMSLSGGDSDRAELTAYFDKLAEGGTVEQPLTPAPWGDTFGMLTDKFGVSWLVNIGAAG